MLNVKAEFDRLKEITQCGCKRKVVRCSVWLDGMNLATTMNGPSGTECTNKVGDCGCSHAEPRVLFYIARFLRCTQPYTMVCTYSPCTNCANIIVDSKLIDTVYYETLTEHDKRGVAILEAGGVRVSQAQ